MLFTINLEYDNDNLTAAQKQQLLGLLGDPTSNVNWAKDVATEFGSYISATLSGPTLPTVSVASVTVTDPLSKGASTQPLRPSRDA
jgi:hypothetical protein